MNYHELMSVNVKCVHSKQYDKHGRLFAKRKRNKRNKPRKSTLGVLCDIESIRIEFMPYTREADEYLT